MVKSAVVETEETVETEEAKESKLRAQLEQFHELLDSAIRDKSSADIDRYSMQIVNVQRALGYDVSVADANFAHQAHKQLVGVMTEASKTRFDTTIVDSNGVFREPWKARFVAISNELLEGGTNAGSLRISSATRMVSEDPSFAQAVLEQAAIDTEQAAARGVNQR